MTTHIETAEHPSSHHIRYPNETCYRPTIHLSCRDTFTHSRQTDLQALHKRHWRLHRRYSSILIFSKLPLLPFLTTPLFTSTSHRNRCPSIHHITISLRLRMLIFALRTASGLFGTVISLYYSFASLGWASCLRAVCSGVLWSFCQAVRSAYIGPVC